MAQRAIGGRAPAHQESRKSRGHWHRETHVRHRDYAPTLGRFIEREPVGFEAGDNNWYRFVTNGPTAFSDPSGLITITVGALGHDNVSQIILNGLAFALKVVLTRKWKFPRVNDCFEYHAVVSGCRADVNRGVVFVALSAGGCAGVTAQGARGMLDRAHLQNMSFRATASQTCGAGHTCCVHWAQNLPPTPVGFAIPLPLPLGFPLPKPTCLAIIPITCTLEGSARGGTCEELNPRWVPPPAPGHGGSRPPFAPPRSE